MTAKSCIASARLSFRRTKRELAYKLLRDFFAYEVTTRLLLREQTQLPTRFTQIFRHTPIDPVLLFDAVSCGDHEALEQLLESGANPNSCAKRNLGLLIYAADRYAHYPMTPPYTFGDKQPSCLRLLLETPGIDVNTQDINKRTALMHVLRERVRNENIAHNVDAVVYGLLYTGAQKNLRDNFGKTAYDYAIQYKHEPLVQELLRPENQPQKKLSLVERLKEARAVWRLNRPDFWGNNELHRALISKVPDNDILALIGRGVRASAVNHHGLTPLILALREHRNSNIISALFKASKPAYADTDYAQRVLAMIMLNYSNSKSDQEFFRRYNEYYRMLSTIAQPLHKRAHTAVMGLLNRVFWYLAQ